MKDPDRLTVDEAQLASLAQRLEQRRLEPGDYDLLRVMLDTLGYLRRMAQQKAHSIQRLLRLIFGARTEKTTTVLKRDGAPPSAPGVAAGTARPKRKGHGRRAAATCWGAKNVSVAHEQLKAGELCPECAEGKLYDTRRPAVLLHLCAQPIIAGTLFALEKLRCALCGHLFSATAPEAAGREKYHANVAPMLAVMRYGYGLPMNRIEQMQEDCGVPLPSGTQWELIQPFARELEPVLAEYDRQSAGGEVIHNDDTTARILSLEKQIREADPPAPGEPKSRTGVFTTGVIARLPVDPQTGESHTIARFHSGGRHAGENLQSVLEQRDPDLATPIQMCDGLSRNKPATAATRMANCNAHARRGFVEVATAFPQECEHVLESFEQVYRYEAQTRRAALSDEERLRFHQEHSAPVLAALKQWLEERLASKQVEPNGALGAAIGYMLKRWEPLTLFLREPGVPLDNNICERALKTSIRHRNNSLFYKTENGAHVGDLFMSLIHTCRLTRVNPFDYLTTLRRYSQRLRDGPAAWMPWNYQATAAALANTSA